MYLYRAMEGGDGKGRGSNHRSPVLTTHFADNRWRSLRRRASFSYSLVMRPAHLTRWYPDSVRAFFTAIS